MAVNKNFVVKNGLEVDTNLIFADPANKRVGIASTAPNYTLNVAGGIGVTDVYVSGFTTLTQDLQVGSSGSIFYISDTNNLVGIGTSLPAYLLDVRTSASVGTTALYVYGDAAVTGNLNVTGDIVYDEVSGRNLDISGIATIATLGVSAATTSKDLLVTGVSTFTGAIDANGALDVDGHTELDDVNVSGASTFTGIGTFVSDLYVGGNLNVTGDLAYDEVSGRNINISGLSTFEGLVYAASNVGVGTTNPTSAADTNNTTILNVGIVTANYYYGDISNATGVSTAIHAAVGVSSEGTFIGAGSTIVNFASSNGTAWTVETSGGIATATVTPGASLGMVIALGS